MDFSRYDAALHDIYAAATDPQRWPRTLHVIADLFQASRAMLWAVAGPGDGIGFRFTHNITERELQIYEARGGANCDPLLAAAYQQGLMADGAALIGSELVPSKQLVHTAFYRDVWEPSGIVDSCSGLVFAGTDSMTVPTILSVYRSPSQPAFTEHTKQLMRRLTAHLSRALGVMFHLRGRDLHAASMTAALDALAQGVLLLDERRKILFANCSAKPLLLAGHSVRVAHNRADQSAGTFELAAGQPLAIQRDFERLCARAGDATGLDDALDHFSSALVLHADDGRPRCVLHVAPAPADLWVSGLTPRSIVFIYDLDAVNVAPTTLCTLFCMTPAEARAALQVVVGGSTHAMAARLQVSVHTFKTQLQAAFSKTTTHRQSDLLKLLLSLSRP